MATTSSDAPSYVVEVETSYTPTPATAERRRSKKQFSSIFFSSFILLQSVLLIISQSPGCHANPNDIILENKPSISTENFSPARLLTKLPSRGVSQGVSEKVFQRVSSRGLNFAWSISMLSWQRAAFHFQPEKNWMNDPCGPLFHMGWYHLFYQHNPDSAVWGNISWGHAVSEDLIHWFHLPLILVPDQSYDINGVWTGSATILPDGRIMMLYTGENYDIVQVQCLAYPADLSDPLLLEWVKDPSNPVMVPPPGIDNKDFRDPTTAWLSPNGDKWRIAIGSKINKAGVALVYETTDFIKYELLDGYLHEVPGTGMWECVDFYPISLTEANGLDTSANGQGIKHVMKASMDDDKNDYFALGTYDPIKNKWIPDDQELDAGFGRRYDHGNFYASKTFYDYRKQRRILLGWIRETDSEDLDMSKGWAGVQPILRTILFDKKTGSNILQWPIEEVESLRSDGFGFNIQLGPGSMVPIKVDSASQLDIVASFEIDTEALEAIAEADIGYYCPISGGAVNRGILGPFGIVVLPDETLTELTPIYFYVAIGTNGKAETHFCVDQLRSSMAPDVDRIVYGSKVPVLNGEKLTLRSLVDHSIVESFAQGGRTAITSRVYPTQAINSRVFLFNNATEACVTASVKIWKMESADICTFPFDQLLISYD